MELKPGYQHTQIGVIPEDWEAKCLGEIGEALIGLTYSPDDVSSDGLLVLRSSNIVDGRLSFGDNVFVQTEVPERIIVREGDILICVRNGSRALIGKCAKIDKRAEGMTFGAFMAVFRTDLHDYVFYQFQSSNIERQIHAHLGATINQITNASLNSFRIPFPPTLHEQETIAAALSDVDALISALDRLIAKKRLIKQGAMQELLIGKKRLPEFGEEWVVKRLGDLADLKNGYAFKSSTYNPLGQFNIITIANVQDGYMDLSEGNRIDVLPSDIQSHHKLQLGDVLISMTGNVGRVCQVSDTNCLLNQRVGKLIPLQIASGFLFALLGQRRFLTAMTGKAKGGAQGNLSVADITEFQFTIPPTEAEQTAIATILSDMDAEIAALEQRRDKTKLLKQGMMQELLTGKTRLV